jgi:hypothetical protein
LVIVQIDGVSICKYKTPQLYSRSITPPPDESNRGRDPRVELIVFAAQFADVDALVITLGILTLHPVGGLNPQELVDL